MSIKKPNNVKKTFLNLEYWGWKYLTFQYPHRIREIIANYDQSKEIISDLPSQRSIRRYLNQEGIPRFLYLNIFYEAFDPIISIRDLEKKFKLFKKTIPMWLFYIEQNCHDKTLDKYLELILCMEENSPELALIQFDIYIDEHLPRLRNFYSLVAFFNIYKIAVPLNLFDHNYIKGFSTKDVLSLVANTHVNGKIIITHNEVHDWHEVELNKSYLELFNNVRYVNISFNIFIENFKLSYDEFAGYLFRNVYWNLLSNTNNRFEIKFDKKDAELILSRYFLNLNTNRLEKNKVGYELAKLAESFSEKINIYDSFSNDLRAEHKKCQALIFKIDNEYDIDLIFKVEDIILNKLKSLENQKSYWIVLLFKLDLIRLKYDGTIKRRDYHNFLANDINSLQYFCIYLLNGLHLDYLKDILINLNELLFTQKNHTECK